MNYSGLIKSLATPGGFQPPDELVFEDIRARPIGRGDLQDDVRGINSSLDLILRTRGRGWPTEPVTEEGNFQDLVWHELEHREGYSYAYVVRRADDSYLGCCYFYPVGRRVALTEQLTRHDVDVSWWVTESAYAEGLYTRLYQALRIWAVERFPFTNPYFSNIEIPHAF